MSTCPPCTGTCRQGRDCPLNQPDDRQPLSRREAWIVLALISSPWALGCLVLWAVRSCAS